MNAHISQHEIFVSIEKFPKKIFKEAETQKWITFIFPNFSLEDSLFQSYLGDDTIPRVAGSCALCYSGQWRNSYLIRINATSGDFDWKDSSFLDFTTGTSRSHLVTTGK